MNSSNKTFLLRLTCTTSSLVAGLLLACSSSSRDGFGTAEDPIEPGKSDASAPSSPGAGAPGTAAPDGGGSTGGDCKLTPPTNACGVAPQCGCAEGKTCDVVDSRGDARCVTAGNTPMGHPCGSTASCAVGLTCVFGTCHAFCNNPGQPCGQPGTGECAQVRTTDDKDVPNLAVCRVACEPYDPTSCGSAVCNVDPQGQTECQTGGTKKEGDECSPTDTCGPGLGCVTADKTSTCHRWCRLGENDCGDKTCNGFSPDLIVNGVPYGSCS